MNKKIIIGFVGRIACGKGAASAYVSQKLDFSEIEYSGFLDEVFMIFGVPASRTAYQQLSLFLRSNYGADAFERATIKKIRSEDSSGFVLSGVRRKSDFENLAREFDFHLIYIDTPQALRYEWLRARSRSVGDQEMSFEDFCVRDNAESEIQIEALREKCIAMIENTGSKEELLRKVDTVLNEIRVGK